MKWIIKLMVDLAAGLPRPKTLDPPPVSDSMLFAIGQKLPECRKHDLSKHRVHAYRYEDLLM